MQHLNEPRRFGPLSEYNTDELNSLIRLISGCRVMPGDQREGDPVNTRRLEVVVSHWAVRRPEDLTVASVVAPFNTPAFDPEYRATMYELLEQVVDLIPHVSLCDDWLTDFREGDVTRMTEVATRVTRMERPVKVVMNGKEVTYTVVATCESVDDDDFEYCHEPPDYNVSYVSICGVSLPENRIVGTLEEALACGVRQLYTLLLSRDHDWSEAK